MPRGRRLVVDDIIFFIATAVDLLHLDVVIVGDLHLFCAAERAGAANYWVVQQFRSCLLVERRFALLSNDLVKAFVFSY